LWQNLAPPTLASQYLKEISKHLLEQAKEKVLNAEQHSASTTDI